MAIKETLAKLYAEISQLVSFAIGNSFKPAETAKDPDFIGKALSQIEGELEVMEIIEKHKLLNYVLKNKKCANMYKLEDDEIGRLRKRFGLEPAGKEKGK